MVKNTKKLIVAVVLALVILSTMAIPALALTASDTVAYPFRKASAFEYAPTFVGPTTNGDKWTFAQVKFDKKTDLSAATYIGYEIEIVKGAPGIDYGIVTDGGNRFGTHIDGADKAFFVKQDGTVTGLTVQYAAITLAEGTKGMLLIPMASLLNRNFADDGLDQAIGFYMCANTLYNNNYEIKIGEVGYYTGREPTADSFHKLLDISTGEKKSNYVTDMGEWKFPSDAGVVDYLSGKTIEYPFRTGETAFNNATAWVGPSERAAADGAWQTMFVSFDTATVDLSNATYVAVQYMAKNGTPGLTYGMESGSGRYSIGNGMDGKPIYMIGEDGKIVKNGNVLHGASNVGTSGALLIPMTSMSWQWGGDTNTLATVKNFLLTTNSFYNWNYEVVIGEIGYYTGNPTDGGEFHKILDLANGAKDDKFFVAEGTTKYTYVAEQTVYGDAKLNYFATGMNAGQIIPWTGGALGEQDVVVDSYGATALKLTSTGQRDGADAYTAFDLTHSGYDGWAGKKGVTMWVKNLSDTEISFNLQMDVTSSKTEVRGRFNVTQGHRFWLYDINSGEQYIYMSAPEIAIPKGFEGWIRVPFEAFEQAAWSVDSAGAFEREYFMTEGCKCAYLGITVNSLLYANKSFAINKIGTYSTTPYLVSAWFAGDDTHKTIPQLMGLEG